MKDEIILNVKQLKTSAIEFPKTVNEILESGLQQGLEYARKLRQYNSNYQQIRVHAVVCVGSRKLVSKSHPTLI
jgi:hypothetical protein